MIGVVVFSFVLYSSCGVERAVRPSTMLPAFVAFLLKFYLL